MTILQELEQEINRAASSRNHEILAAIFLDDSNLCLYGKTWWHCRKIFYNLEKIQKRSDGFSSKYLVLSKKEELDRRILVAEKQLQTDRNILSFSQRCENCNACKYLHFRWKKIPPTSVLHNSKMFSYASIALQQESE